MKSIGIKSSQLSFFTIILLSYFLFDRLEYSVERNNCVFFLLYT